MEIYKNDYLKDEDEVLWEIHEIRNKIHKEIKSQDLSEINKKSKDLFKSWKNRTSNLVNR